VGDKGKLPFEKEEDQYNMKYFQSSDTHNTSLILEWTTQHGFGTNDKLNSDVIIQMMCQPDEGEVDALDRLRDGINIQKQGFKRNGRLSETYDGFVKRKSDSVSLDKGLHESFDYYDKCKNRMRNKGLFIANKKFKRQDSTFTRQNNGGKQSGYECPEERDYFPYWEPTPWIDIAILTSNYSKCAFYKNESFNVQPRGECISFQKDPNSNSVTAKVVAQYNKTLCNEYSGPGEIKWVELHNYLELRPNIPKESCLETLGLKWGFTISNYYKEQCFQSLSAPECQLGRFIRVNHNGNPAGSLDMINYDWKIPYFPSEKEQRCVLRMRYNISTDDYDPQDTFVGDIPTNMTKNNPQVKVGEDEGEDINIQLNIATNQFGRTFQDRSHVFILKPRLTEEMKDLKIHNINVRGKRGNIVQVYPAVEYDYTPNNLRIEVGDGVHFQWTGSNTHNNANPAGDGEAGDDGQGDAGTDRHNCVALDHPSRNYPMDFENVKSIFMNIDKIKWHSKFEEANLGALEDIDIAVSAASSGLFKTRQELDDPNSVELDPLLDNAPASYEGFVATFNRGIYHYMCTRNNAFTNRSQKGKLVVGEPETS